MAWLKLDDQIFLNRKVARCDPETKLLYVVSLAYCANQLTDGEIPKDVLPLLAGMAGIDKQNAKQSASKLLDVCLWVASPFGWQIPDYLEYNPSREQVEHNRIVRSEAGRRGGMAKPSKTEAKAKQIAKQNTKQNGSKSEPPSPSPSERDKGPAGTQKPLPQDAEWAAAVQSFEAAVGKLRLPQQQYTLQEMQETFDELRAANRVDWWQAAVNETVKRGGGSWSYMVKVLDTATRTGKAPGYTNGQTAANDPDNRPLVPAPSKADQAAADARQADYERQIAEQLARAGRLQ